MKNKIIDSSIRRNRCFTFPLLQVLFLKLTYAAKKTRLAGNHNFEGIDVCFESDDFRVILSDKFLCRFQYLSF